MLFFFLSRPGFPCTCSLNAFDEFCVICRHGCTNKSSVLYLRIYYHHCIMFAVRFSHSALDYTCQTHWLTCARCLRYPVQRPDLPQLESGPHFMTAVRVHVDHVLRKYDYWQDPKESARGYAWAYFPGHGRISHQVSLWVVYCSLIGNCVAVLKIDGTWAKWSDDEFKHLTDVSDWFSHYW